MSDLCNIDIHFDNDKRCFKSGDVVSGNVVFKPNTTFECRKLVVEYYWSTHGKGNVDKNVIDTVLDSPGRLLAEREYTVPFSFIVAKYPITYHGEYINIDHYIGANADVALRSDPAAKEDFIVEPGPESYSEYEQKHQPFYDIQHSYKKNTSIVGSIIFGVILIIFLIFLTQFAIVIGLIFVATQTKRYLTMKKLGAIDATFPNIPVVPGECISASIAFVPSKKFVANSVSCILTCTEQAVSGSGTKKTTHKKTCVTLENIATNNYSVDVNGMNVFSFDFTVPENTQYTFTSPSNEIVWNMEIKVDIRSWPDFSESCQLLVFPKKVIVESGV